MTLRSTAVLALAALAAACSSTSTSSSVPATPAMSPYEIAQRDGDAFTLVILRRGQSTDAIDTAAMAELTSAHMQFTEDMVQSRYVLANGPFVGQRVERDLRSLAIVDATDVQSAFNEFCSDPAAEAGVLTVEAIPFVAHQNLRALPGAEESMHATRGTESNGVRPYVIVEGPTGAAFRSMIERMGDMAVLSGDCLEGSFAGRTLCVLDCRTPSEAMVVMEAAVGKGSDEFRYHPWMGSIALTDRR